MKRFKTDELIDSLKKDVQRLLECTIILKGEKDMLLQQPAPDKWSVAQIIEHLNGYGRYYLPQISKALTTHPQMQRQAWFNPGFFGNYFTNALKPKSVLEVKNKMKAMKSHSPDNNLQPNEVLNEFVRQQQQLLELLEQSKMSDLNALRIPVSISKLIKLKLGDTFRFVIAHEQRHFIQARNTLQALGVSTGKWPVILPEAER
jgi:hypothetical protein